MISAINNTSVLSAIRTLHKNQQGLYTALERLSTGKKINSGKDNPAGLIVSERLKSEIRVLEAQTNSLRRVNSNATILDGNLSQLSGLMTDLKGLVASSANSGAMSPAEIQANQMQIDSIVNTIQRFSGDAQASLDGVNLPNDGNAQINTDLSNSAAALQAITSGGANDMASGNFNDAYDAIDSAMTDVLNARGAVGTYQKYDVQSSINQNMVTYENLTASLSVIADADFAVETAKLQQFKILMNANMMALKIGQNQIASILDLFG